MKAHLAGAGEDGSYYRDFSVFTIKELRQHIGLYVFNGVAPTPRVEFKFKPQRSDTLFGNDFVFLHLVLMQKDATDISRHSLHARILLSRYLQDASTRTGKCALSSHG